MVEQIANRNRPAIFRKLREKVGEMVVVAQLAIPRQQHDARRRELLGKRRQPEVSARIDLRPRTKVANAVAAAKHCPSVADDKHSSAGSVTGLERCENGLDLSCGNLDGSGDRGKGERQQQRDCESYLHSGSSITL